MLIPSTPAAPPLLYTFRYALRRLPWSAMRSSRRSSRFSSSFHAANTCCSRFGAAVGIAPSPPSKWARPFCQSCEIKLGLICNALALLLHVHGYPAELSGLESVLPRRRAGTMTSADSRCSFLAHRCARSRLLRQNNGSLRIRHAAFTQCKPNLPCALLTEYRA